MGGTADTRVEPRRALVSRYQAKRPSRHASGRNRHETTGQATFCGPFLGAERVRQLAEIARVMRLHGNRSRVIENRLQRINREWCRPPLDDVEVARIAKAGRDGRTSWMPLALSVVDCEQQQNARRQPA